MNSASLESYHNHTAPNSSSSSSVDGSIINRSMRMKSLSGRAQKVVALVGTIAIYGIIEYASTMPVLSSLTGINTSNTSFRRRTSSSDAVTVHIPPSVDEDVRRNLQNMDGGATYLGGTGPDACRWEAPADPSLLEGKTWAKKTLIAGFPSCDKRMTFAQMEALTGWPARDEWDFCTEHSYGQNENRVTLPLPGGYTNHPFIKSNFPHHEGKWCWSNEGYGTRRLDQVVLVVRNIRKTMVEYHDILHDISSVKISEGYLATDIILPSTINSWGREDIFYNIAAPTDSWFLEFRDERVMEEISWYSWFIDFWMEGGLRRDVFSHRITDQDSWPFYPEEEERICETKHATWHAHKTIPNTCTNDGIIATMSPSRSPTPFPSRSPSISPTLQPTPANFTELNLTKSPLPAHVPNPAPLPPPPLLDPVPVTFDSLAECCQTLFPDSCSFIDDCPTPSPTPAIESSYHGMCNPDNLAILGGCQPLAVVSAEKLRDTSISATGKPVGQIETETIARTLSNAGVDLIDERAWECVWTELIPRNKGMRMVTDRPGYSELDYKFSSEMLDKMIAELDYLVNKYSGNYWTSTYPDTAPRLVELLSEHRFIIQAEYEDFIGNGGNRALRDEDFLGPSERERRRRLRAEEAGLDPDASAPSPEDRRASYEYFSKLEAEAKASRTLHEVTERQREIRMAQEEKARMLAEAKSKVDEERELVESSREKNVIEQDDAMKEVEQQLAQPEESDAEREQRRLRNRRRRQAERRQAAREEREA